MSRCKHKDYRFKFLYLLSRRCNVPTEHNRNFCDKHLADYKYPSRKPKNSAISFPFGYRSIDSNTVIPIDADILRNVLP